jgi:hypothetical protein
VPAIANTPVLMNVLLLLFIGQYFLFHRFIKHNALAICSAISYKCSNILFCNNRQGRKARTADTVLRLEPRGYHVLNAMAQNGEQQGCLKKEKLRCICAGAFSIP